MKQESKETKGLGDKIINQFIQGFLDTRKRESRYLKRMNRSCQKMVEDRIYQTPDLKHLLSQYKSEPWIQGLLVSYILLKMYHQAALWGAETLQAKPALEVQYKRRFYLNRKQPNVPER